jgi:hypothetical protein
MKSATDYYHIQKMLKDEEARSEKEEVPVPERIPAWRVNAIEKVFIEDYAEICRYLTKFPGNFVNPKARQPEDPRRLMTAPYDIKQMIETLKTPDWRKIPPFEHYFKPLQDKLDKSVEQLVKMQTATKLYCRYEISLNDPMHEYMNNTIEQDVIVQTLASNQLKRD